MNNFDIVRSNKAGIYSRDGYIIKRSSTSYLRLVGAEPKWTLMTATASEDTGSVRVCTDQRRLIEAALHTCIEQGVLQPLVKLDHPGREYVVICTVEQKPGESDELVRGQLNVVIARFFEFYDAYAPPEARGRDEMQGLYDALAINEGEDVYLSDGVWLSSDGSLRDSGR